MKKNLVFIIVFLSTQVFAQTNPQWVAIYDSASPINYLQYQMKVSRCGNTYVTGSTSNTTSIFNVLLKYDTNGNLLWSRTFDSLTTYTGDMTIDKAENIYLTGRYLYNNNYYKYCTLKYDSVGNLLWSAFYSNYLGGWNYDMPSAITIDDSSNVYVTGQSPGPNGLNDLDIVTIKYNSIGNQIWIERYDYEGMRDRPHDLIVDSLQNVYITGETMDSLGNEYFIILKYDSSGSLAWASKYNDGVYNGGIFIKIDKASNLYAGGYADNGNADGKYKLLKYDNNGNFIWAAEYDIAGTHEIPADMLIDEYANIYMTGTQIAWSGYYDDFATVKFDSSGQQVWVRTYNGGPGYDDPHSIIEDGAGNILIAGSSQQVSNSSNFDYYTMKYDSSGVTLWSANFEVASANSWQEASSIGIDSMDNIYVSGFSNTLLNPKKITTIKYSAITGIDENDFSNTCHLFPNPANSSLSILLPSLTGQSLQIAIFTPLGQQVYFSKEKIEAGKFSRKISVQNLSNGIYILQIKADAGILNKKVVVQH